MDAAADAGTDAAIAFDGACLAAPGPVMVLAGSFCIDSTEVSNAHYAAYLASDAGLANTGPCSYKTTHVPSNWPPSRTDTPVTEVDWCDAYAYCAWAGKRLCGMVGGGAAVGLTDMTDQWFSACTHGNDGAHAFAYGSSFVAGTCNTPELDAGDVVPVGTLTGCVGGYPGLFDMIGNVYEWEDACIGNAGASDVCVARSGSYSDPPGASDNCEGSGTSARNFAQPDFGFRCCYP